MRYFLCIVGAFKEGGEEAIIEDCLTRNVYQYHDCTKQKGAYSDITIGDTVILVYKKEICAYGIADSQIGDAQGYDADWQALSIKDKWIRATPNIPLPYGVYWHTLIGNKQSVVKEIDGLWANYLILLITLNNDRAKLPDEPVIPLYLPMIASFLNNSFLRIPAVQRGKVWNAVRAEILWDSLLRNIPIGTLSIRPVLDKTTKECHWDLLDGQQRTNAIAMGFHEFPAVDSDIGHKLESILWIDLKMTEADTEQNDKKTRHSERRFFFKVTTAAHPWGYKLSDNETKNSTLEEWRKREAVEKLKGHWEKHNQMGSRPYPYELWPTDAIFPVPFDVLRKFVEQGGSKFDEFSTYCVEHHSNSNWVLRYYSEGNYCFPAIEENHWLKLIKAIQELSYVVVLAQNSKQIPDEDVGLYFKRMNKAGEVPSDEEIQYSLLKSKVPSLKKLDSIADGLMQPSRMANIAMLSYLTRRGKWSNTISIANISELASDQKFVDYIKNELADLLTKVKEKVVYSTTNECGIPKVNFSSIALRYPELFRLLLYFTEKKFDIQKENLIAFIFLIVLYGNGIKMSAGYNYYKATNNWLGPTKETWLWTTKTWLLQAIRQGELLIPPTPTVYNGILGAVSTNVFSKVDLAWKDPSYVDAINATWQWTTDNGRFLLLYSTRKYLEENFPGYDPVDITWCEENRPWDYDHIFPQDWLRSGRGVPQGKFHQLVDEFLNSIGNIAPIAFSQNRGKGAKPPCAYMGEDNEKLFVSHEVFFDEEHSGKNGSTSLEMNKDLAFSFARITSTRWCKLYNEFYNSSGMAKLLDFSEVTDKRRDLFNYLTEHQQDFKCYYVLPDGTQKIISNHLDMARPWIACGRIGTIVIDGDEHPCMVCVASNGELWEIGVRRHPEATSILNDSSKWWFDGLYECIDNAKDQEILAKIDTLLENVASHQITLD